MVSYLEINSFVTKFCQLWNDGLQADMHLHCFNGQSFVNLNVGLGYARKGFNGKYDNNFNTRSRRSFK